MRGARAFGASMKLRTLKEGLMQRYRMRTMFGFATLGMIIFASSANATESACEYGRESSATYEASVNAKNANCPVELLNFLRASNLPARHEVIFGDFIYHPLSRTVVRASFHELSDASYPHPRLSRFLSGISFVGKDRGKKRYDFEHKKELRFNHARFGTCTANVRVIAQMTLENACTTFA